MPPDDFLTDQKRRETLGKLWENLNDASASIDNIRKNLEGLSVPINEWGCGDDVESVNECPDDRHVSLNETAISSSMASFSFEMIANMPGRLCYYPASDPSAILYTNAELSSNFGAPGNAHNQDIFGLAQNTQYFVISQTLSPDGVNWVNLSCPLSFQTIEQNDTVLEFNTFELTDGSNIANMQQKNTDETLILFTPNASLGIDPKLDLDPNEREVWFCFDVFIPLSFQPTSNVKFPGIASAETSFILGGQGGGGSGDDKACSGRMIVQRPNTGFVPFGVGYELYDDNSANAPFGEPEWWGNNGAGSGAPTLEAQLIPGQWNRIKQHLKMNTPGLNDGVLEGYINGVLQYQELSLGCTDDDTTADGDPNAQELSIWMDFYIGGAPDTGNQTQTLCVRNEQYNYGSVCLV